MPDFTILYFTGNSYEWACRAVDISMILSELNMAVGCTASSITGLSEAVGLKQKNKKWPLISHAQHLISAGTVMDQPWLKSSELFHRHTTEGIWLYYSGRIVLLSCIRTCFIWCFFSKPMSNRDMHTATFGAVLISATRVTFLYFGAEQKSHLQQIWMWDK